MGSPGQDGLVLERAIRSPSTPERVLSAFFQPRDLAAWWEVSHAVTMALEFETRSIEDGRTTDLVIRQSAESAGPRWQRYFAVLGDGWDRALDALREHLEWSGLRFG